MTVKKTENKDNAIGEVVFEDMKHLLHNFGKNRVSLLDCLRQYGPASGVVLANKLRRNKYSVIQDLAYLASEGLLDHYSKGLFYVAWDSVEATVQHHNYETRKNVINLVDLYLYSCARKYPWFKLKIKLRIIERGVPKFSCSLMQVFE